jgi:hypothetical protein
MHPVEDEAMAAAAKRSGLDAWEVASVLNLAEDIKASKYDGWTFSHFCNEGERLGVAIQHRSGVYAVVHNQRDLSIKVREFDMVDAYIKTQVAALTPSAPAPAAPVIVQTPPSPAPAASPATLNGTANF